MQIVVHLGAHFTDDDGLIKTLLGNETMLRARGVAVPRPKVYRRMLRDLLDAAKARRPDPGLRDQVLGELLQGYDAPVRRIVISHPNLLCVTPFAARNGVFYHRAVRHLGVLDQVFAGDDLVFCMAIRSPATFLPELYYANDLSSMSEVINGVSPQQMRWSELFERVRAALPGRRFKLWCDEDAPLIRGEILRWMAGLEAHEPLEGEFDLLQRILRPQAMERFVQYCQEHPDMNAGHQRRVIAAFLERFMLPDEVEIELDVPGWDEALISALEARYDEDCLRINAMNGVELLAP